MGNNPTIFEPLNYYSLPHKNTVENKNFWGREKRNYFSSLKTIPVYIYYITKERWYMKEKKENHPKRKKFQKTTEKNFFWEPNIKTFISSGKKETTTTNDMNKQWRQVRL